MPESDTLTMESRRKVVMTIHGIRTRGEWQKRLDTFLASKEITPVSLDYDYFPALHMLFRSKLEKKVAWFRDEYTRHCKEHSCNDSHRPSIVAHSLGAYIVAHALEKYPEIKFQRVILCGSIVREDFPWDQIIEERGQVRFLLNDCGGKDIWVSVAEWAVKDAGPSGSKGFSVAPKLFGKMWERKNPNFAHSCFFYEANYKENWIPFLREETPGPLIVLRPPKFNWKYRILRLAIFICVLLGILYGSLYYYQKLNPELHIPNSPRRVPSSP